MGGGGKGGGGGGDIPPEIEEAAKQMRQIGEEQFALGLPIMQQGGKNALEMLRTGRTKAFEPAIRTAVEGTRSRQSQGFQQLNEEIARSGLTGTAAQEALARGRLGAESAVAQVPSQFTLPFLQGAFTPTLNLTEQGLGGISAAGQLGGVAAGPGRPSGNALGGALGGAATGAQLGSYFPGYGTIIGAGVGALAGGLGGK